MAGEIAVPKSMSAWCAGIWDYGMLGNRQTGLIQNVQVHITVTNDKSNVGVGFHISVYVLGSGGYVLSDWNPQNALARKFYYPGKEASGVVRESTKYKGLKPEIIEGLKNFEAVTEAGVAFFFAKYPAYAKPEVLHVGTFDEEFPPLS